MKTEEQTKIIEKNKLIEKNRKKEKIGWYLEIPALLLLALLVSARSIVAILVIMIINLVYLIAHLIFFSIIYRRYKEKLGSIEFDIEFEKHKSLEHAKELEKTSPQQEHRQKCSYCGYSTPSQYKKCEHCGAIL